MNWTDTDILQVLDECCDAYTFPMLDNGYVYLAAARLAAYRSEKDWHITIEVFGYSPRSGLPDIQVYNFGSNLQNRKTAADFVSVEAYENFLHQNPSNDSVFLEPISAGDWIDPDDPEMVSTSASTLLVRDMQLEVPALESYAKNAIMLERTDQAAVFELCRLIAGTHRQLILATEVERKYMVPEGAKQLLLLDEWNHPDVADEEARPSGSETFQQIAKALYEGSPDVYSPGYPSNTHWSNWPFGGTL